MVKTLTVVRSTSDEWHLLRKLFAFYKKSGFRVKFVGWDRLREKDNLTVRDGVLVNYIQKGWGYANWRLAVGIPIWMAKLATYCALMEADYAHLMDLDSGFPSAVILWFRRIPYIYDIQDNFDQRHNWPLLIGEIIRLLDDWVIKHAKFVIVTDKNRITSRMRRHSEKILILPNCPPDVSIPPAKEGPPRSFRVYALGRLAEKRGIDLLLEACRRIQGVEIIMAGVFVEDWLKNKALAMPNVEFRGWLPMEKALELGAETDVFFSFYDPSIQININASSNKWYDAMMLSKPVIVNREIEKAGWIEKEGFGYTCPYGSVESLIAVLEEVRNHPEIAKNKGRKGRALFDSEFNWSSSEKKLLAYIEERLTC